MTDLIGLKKSIVKVLKDVSSMNPGFYAEDCPAYEDVEAFFDKLDKELQELQAENARLKSQLTWRPVSEKPEREDYYFVKFTYQDGEIGYDVAEYEYEQWMHCGDVIGWLPIPKEAL